MKIKFIEYGFARGLVLKVKGNLEMAQSSKKSLITPGDTAQDFFFSSQEKYRGSVPNIDHH